MPAMTFLGSRRGFIDRRRTCPTGNDPTIAQCLGEGFGPRRAEVVGKLLAIQSIPVYSPLTVTPG